MIRPLRRAHRRLMLALCILLPLMLTAALVLRPDPPLQPDWPFDTRRPHLQMRQNP